MASAVTICNLALSRIGDRASISSIDPPDGSEQAEVCGRFYKLALGTILDRHDWNFATRRYECAELAGFDPAPYLHAYGLPSDCRRVINMQNEIGAQREAHFPTPYTHEHDIPFEIVVNGNRRILLTNVDAPTIRYIVDDPKEGNFPASFVDALAWKLAGMLCGETIRGETSFQFSNSCEQMFERAYLQAIEADSNQKKTPRNHIPVWIWSR